MRLTSKGRYAVTAMLDVALNSEAGPVPLADISERQGISLSYLEQLFSRLRKNGLVSSVVTIITAIFFVPGLCVDAVVRDDPGDAVIPT